MPKLKLQVPINCPISAIILAEINFRFCDVRDQVSLLLTAHWGSGQLTTLGKTLLHQHACEG